MVGMRLEDKKELLKKRGIMVTIQRAAILEFLDGNTDHPSAEEIYRSLKVKYPSISRATVYNTLDLLKRHGLIQEINIERSKAHYDYNTVPHHHFCCRRCGGIYDVAMEGLPVKVGGEVEGHIIERAWLYMDGICARCRYGGEDAGAT